MKAIPVETESIKLQGFKVQTANHQDRKNMYIEEDFNKPRVHNIKCLVNLNNSINEESKTNTPVSSQHFLFFQNNSSDVYEGRN